jgi:HlyD family secretion protein
MFDKKWVLWLVILFIALLPMPAIIQYLQTFIVRNAVVTAYRYEVHAAIDGVVDTLDARPGEVPGEEPVVLKNRRVPRADMEALEARHREKEKYHAFLLGELSTLETRQKASQQLLWDYRTLLENDLDQTLAILKARQEGEAARLKETKQIRTRAARLLQTSTVAQADIDRTEAGFLEAQARFNATGLERQQIEHRRQMLQQNLFLSDFSDGIFKAQELTNDLQMEIFHARRRIQTAETKLAEDAARLTALRRDMAHKLTTAIVELPDTAVIWDVEVRTGMEVTKGDRMLSYIDRSQLLVDVAIDDATIALIHPDHLVRIRLFGSGRSIQGKVIQVMGSGSKWPDHRFAAGVKDKSVRDGRVLVQIDDPQLSGDTKRFCGVGRTAYAEFEGIGLIEQYFGTFMR